jgi:hypothetical protein
MPMINLKTMGKSEIASRFMQNILDEYIVDEQSIVGYLKKATAYNDTEYIDVLNDWLIIVRRIRSSARWLDIERGIAMYKAEQLRRALPGESYDYIRSQRDKMYWWLVELITLAIDPTEPFVQLKLFDMTIKAF